MLRGINPILSPDLLYILRAMAHGDEIVIADANFPAQSLGPRVVRLDGVNATEALSAILSLMPLDDFTKTPAFSMQVVGEVDAVPEAVKEFQQVINDEADNPAALASLERYAFYDRAKAAFAVVQTGETRLYGNILLKKGVVR
ncbi:MAG: ribose ABC transporter [Alphaproteobacteria bacterium]|nr:ribose ABC transporter [Alphaproteobacteria bacterium]